MGSIQLGFKDVGGTAGYYQHGYAVYTNDAGVQSIVRGGPQYDIGTLGSASGTTEGDGYGPGPGSIVATIGPYDVNSKDFPRPGDKRTFYTLAAGDDSILGPQFQQISEIASAIGSADISGHPLCAIHKPSAALVSTTEVPTRLSNGP